MSDQAQADPNGEWRCLLECGLGSASDKLLFRDWDFAIRRSEPEGTAETVPATVDDAFRFISRATVLDHEFGSDESVFSEIIDTWKELAFLSRYPQPFLVQSSDGTFWEFSPKGWTLLAVAAIDGEGQPMRERYSAIDKPVYLFEWNGVDPQWLVIHDGAPPRAEAISARDAAKWLWTTRSELSPAVREALKIGPLTGDQLPGLRMPAPDVASDFQQAEEKGKETPPSSPHDTPDDVSPAENASESTSPLSRLDDESDNAASCGLVVGDDGQCVNWNGTLDYFTPNQAKIVQELHGAWLNGVPDVASRTLLEAVDHASQPRSVSEVFRERRGGKTVKHRAMGTLIVQGARKGTYRFNVPVPSDSDDRS